MSSREDFAEHVMPNGAVCFYRDSDHSYWPSIKPKSKKPDAEWSGCKPQLTGVSTVSGPFDFQPDNLMRWSARTNGIGIALLAADALALEDADDIKTALAWLEDHTTIWKALQEAGLTYEDLREQRADEGTNVHKHALYALASGKAVPDYDEMTAVEHGYAQGVAAFWLEHDPLPLQAEQVVIDLGLGVAGRFDLRARLRARCGRPKCPCQSMLLLAEGETPPTPGAGLFMADAKTSGFIPTKHHVQVAGYEHCASVSGLGETEAQWILQVDPAGGWELIPCRANAEDFAIATYAYRRSARIAKDAKNDRKEREE